MPKVKLTDAAVQRYKAAPGERVNYFDAALPGFALRVSGKSDRNPAGSKNWILFYRHGGKQKMLTFDPGYPALGLADAREKARDALQLLGRGDDPARAKQALEQKARDQARDTVEAVIDEFMTRYMEGKDRSPRYIAETRRIFDLHVIPVWKGRPIAGITRRDAIALLDGIADGAGGRKSGAADKRRGARGGKIAANRAQAALSKLFNWAISRDILEASPVVRIEKPGSEKKRERVLTDREILLVWQGADQLGYPFGPFFKLCLVLARRREEVAAIGWDELPADPGAAAQGPFGALWTIPGARTKSGRPWVMPLPPLALAILAECPKKGRHVFTTRRRRGAGADDLDADAPISGYSKAKDAIDVAISALAAEQGVEVPAHWTNHDLRRTATTTMGGLDVPRFIQKRILDHADNEVTGIYDRYEYLAEKRDALEKWGRYLEALLSPTGGNIVPFPAAAAGAA